MDQAVTDAGRGDTMERPAEASGSAGPEGSKPPRPERFLEKTARLLSLPGDGAAGLPHLELTGDRDLYLEHYREVLSYNREEIHVDGGAWMLRIIGRNLEIQAMCPGELRIFGWVTGLEFL